MSDQRQALVAAATAAHGAGNLEQAYLGFLAAAKLNPPGEVQFYEAAAHCLAAMGRSAEAIDLYKIFVAVNRDSAAVWFNLAALSFSSQDYAYAASCSTEVIRLTSASPENLLMRFMCCYHARMDEDAKLVLDDYFETACTTFENIQKMLDAINSPDTAERRDEGMAMFHERGKHLLAITILTAHYMRRTHRFDRAIQIMDDFLRSKVRILQNEVEQAYITLAELTLSINDVPGALQRLRRGVERLRDIKYAGSVMYLLGYAHARNGEPGLAVDCYRAAAAHLPREPRFPLIRTTVRL